MKAGVRLTLMTTTVALTEAQAILLVLVVARAAAGVQLLIQARLVGSILVLAAAEAVYYRDRVVTAVIALAHLDRLNARAETAGQAATSVITGLQVTA